MLSTPYYVVGRVILWVGLGLSLFACSSRQESPSLPVTPDRPTPAPTLLSAAALPDLGPAPDFDNKVWLNTDKPLTLAALRGRVVLVEFWTFG